MYRLRSLDLQPLLICDTIVREYGTCLTNTLHVKVHLTPSSEFLGSC